MTQEYHNKDLSGRPFGRRSLLKGTGTLLGASALSTLAAPFVARAGSDVITIGCVSNQSGPGAAFGAATEFAMAQAKDLLKNGLEVGGKTYQVDIILKDGQTSMNRVAAVTAELMTRDKVDIAVAIAGEAPAASGQMAAINKVPFVTTMLQSDTVIAIRGGPEAFSNNGKPWNFNFLFDAATIGACYMGMWETIRAKTNGVVATAYVDLAAARGFADPKFGIPAALSKLGYKIVDGGFFKVETDDFSNQVSAFKDANAQLMTGFMLEPNFATFWKQAAQAGYKPEVVTIAAPFLFPTGLDALGDRGAGMSTEVWWSPKLPFKSTFSGQSTRELATAWEDGTGKQWTPVLGYAHAMFEVTVAALKASGDPKDKEAVRAALDAMKLDSIVGPINFKDSEVRGIARTPLAGGQWVKAKSGKFKYDLQIVYNASTVPLPVEADLKLLSELG